MVDPAMVHMKSWAKNHAGPHRQANWRAALDCPAISDMMAAYAWAMGETWDMLAWMVLEVLAAVASSILSLPNLQSLAVCLLNVTVTASSSLQVFFAIFCSSASLRIDTLHIGFPSRIIP